MDHREFNLEESFSSAFFDKLIKISNIKVSKKSSLSQEATGLAPW